MTTTADDLAARVAEALFPRDVVANDLNMRIEDIGEGRARISMLVTPKMMNGLNVAHGGYIFTLADTAFAYACNSRNQATVAQHAQISFISPVQVGETLTAEATELSQSGRNGLYDVLVKGGDGRTVAAFRGASRSVKGPTAPGLTT